LRPLRLRPHQIGAHQIGAIRSKTERFGRPPPLFWLKFVWHRVC